MAKITKVTAVAHSSASPKRMAVTPQHSARSVRVEGTSLPMLRSSSRSSRAATIWRARSRAGDLHDRQVPGIAILPLRTQADGHALIMNAGLVETGIEELARPIGQRDHMAGNRIAVHMHIEHIHEDRKARARPVSQP